MKAAYTTLFILGFITLLIFRIYQIMHWPGAFILRYVSFTLLISGLCLLIYALAKSKNKTWMIILVFSSYLISCSTEKHELKNKKTKIWNYKEEPPTIKFKIKKNTNQYTFGHLINKVDSIDHHCSFPFLITKFQQSILIDTADFINFSPVLVDSLNKQNIIPEFDGMQLFCNYSDTLPSRYTEYKQLSKFPLYVINKTKRIKYVGMHNNDLFIFQEAYNKETKEWAAISFGCLNMCGSPEMVLEIPDEHCLIVEIPRFNGNYATKIRVKLISENCIYTSNEFEGKISYTQFLLKKYDYDKLKKQPNNFKQTPFTFSEINHSVHQ